MNLLPLPLPREQPNSLMPVLTRTPRHVSGDLPLPFAPLSESLIFPNPLIHVFPWGRLQAGAFPQTGEGLLKRARASMSCLFTSFSFPPVLFYFFLEFFRVPPARPLLVDFAPPPASHQL